MDLPAFRVNSVTESLKRKTKDAAVSHFKQTISLLLRNKSDAGSPLPLSPEMYIEKL
jgi:hypothetical protein